jgi:hypothetical protein
MENVMAYLVLGSHEPTIIIPPPLAAAREGVATEGYKITQKRGSIAGVGVSVSGQGAWAKMKGEFSFQLQQVEKSSTFQSLKSSYNISGGVSGFWSWIGFGANADTHREEIRTALKEMFSAQKVDGRVDVDIGVTGIYPNVQVDASAFILVLQITDNQGSTATVFSNGAPTKDVGAQDQSGNQLPTRDNSSTISI